MSQVQIQIPQNHYDFNDFLFGRLAARVKEIEKRAYQLFEERGLVPGRDQEDWLKAEREINSDATCEVAIDDNAVRIVLSTPGFRPDDLKVNILPGLVVVEGETEYRGIQRERRRYIRKTNCTHVLPPDMFDIDKRPRTRSAIQAICKNERVPFRGAARAAQHSEPVCNFPPGTMATEGAKDLNRNTYNEMLHHGDSK